MTESTLSQIAHWFWVAFFIFMGAFNLYRNNMRANVPGGAVRKRSCEFQERVWEALDRRRSLEHVSTWLRIAPSILCFGLAVMAALTTISPGVLYGAMLLGLSAAMATAFLQIRNRGTVRAAILSPRSASSVIPAFWFFAAGLQALAALAGLPARGSELGAIFVCVSTLIGALLAWRVTEMPAVLTGDDPEAEKFVDSAVRFNRAGSILFFAFVQTFVFIAQVSPLIHSRLFDNVQTASIVLLVAYTVWYLVVLFHKVQPTPAASA